MNIVINILAAAQDQRAMGYPDLGLSHLESGGVD